MAFGFLLRRIAFLDERGDLDEVRAQLPLVFAHRLDLLVGARQFDGDFVAFPFDRVGLSPGVASRLLKLLDERPNFECGVDFFADGVDRQVGNRERGPALFFGPNSE
ncbi:MAG: hypothetical protein WDN28_27195 [Chthoniobacter sp.]